jgi:hypothetical protein
VSSLAQSSGRGSLLPEVVGVVRRTVDFAPPKVRRGEHWVPAPESVAPFTLVGLSLRPLPRVVVRTAGEKLPWREVK